MNFLLLRLLLATSVALSHYEELTANLAGWHGPLSSTVAVQAFFVISGWMVAASYRARPQLLPFFTRRAFRLYPLYVVVVLMQLVLAATLTPSGWARVQELQRYLVANLCFANFLQPDPLGFFRDAPLSAVNPSLWTLKIEVMFYLCVPLIVTLSRGKGRWILPLLLYGASSLFVALAAGHSEELGRQLPGQLRFFLVGMVLGELAEHGPPAGLSPWWLALAGVLGLFLAQVFESSVAWGWAQPLFVGCFVVAAARVLPACKGLPDLSYGIYLLHAPLIQFAYRHGWLPPGLAGLFLALGATAILAACLHYAIEAPAMRWGQSLSRRAPVPARRLRANGHVAETEAR